jgi:transposase
VERFRTTTPELQRLVRWLQEQGIRSVAMESTGVYWIPIYELLQAEGIEVVLVNARHLSGVPGRKSDFLDCQWLQQLHSCGLLKGSFRPDEAICRLRAVHRERANLIAERTRIVTGVTGLAIVRAIVAGERDAQRLAQWRDRRCQKSVDQIAEYLSGSWREEHLFNLAMGLRRYDEIERVIAAYDAQLQCWITELQAPERSAQFVPAHPNAAKQKKIRQAGEHPAREALWRWAGADLCRIDGIRAPAAETVLTEIGVDLSAFATEHYFVSWLRLSPKTATSAGKPVPTRRASTAVTRVAGVLRMAALSLSRSPTALGAYYRRVARRKGAAVAIFATARKLAQLIYRMLRYGQDYVDEGAKVYEARFEHHRLRQLTDTALQLGYRLVPVVDAA